MSQPTSLKDEDFKHAFKRWFHHAYREFEVRE
jgi:hypothetical protein